MPEMQLSWQPGFSLSRKPVRRSRASRASVTLGRRQQFEFIVERPVLDHGIGSTESGVAFESYRRGEEISQSDRTGLQRGRYSTNQSSSPGEDDSRESLLVDDNWQINVTGHQLSVTDNCKFSDLHTIDETELQLTLNPFYENTASPSFPPSIVYHDLYQRFHPVLKRYNEEFCRIPLTADLGVNPFRYRARRAPEPMFLVHAVMALAGHHVESTSTQGHRHAAIQLLREGIDMNTNLEHGYSILDAIIILFSLDETQSALGHWRTHLLGAYGLLEACGGINTWITSARTQVQIGILLWWDAITSLVNREDCIFPHPYFETLLSNYTGKEWDFFSLCGCPLRLVEVVMKLSRLSAEKRQSSSMQHVIFDTTVLSGIEHTLESWHHISPATAFQDEESMQQDQDRMHCSEAWRNGLLLYLYRVFHWKPGHRVPVSIIYRARVIMDHVVACRDESMVSRQALLPLFFAGCELQDPESRRKILKLCSEWSDKTRYRMFGTTIPLLGEVWAEQSSRGIENVWWGEVVDRQRVGDDTSPLRMRICFG
ncbi:hypothetical protein BO70DRAFT_333069 [Aspergillus heteromorphus CBS 117.55]|uniref:Fungal-specific transcription factor domain-containing protein n=1 Tax=Aspergillus heteromorphus CBS 117.55 TaxID=1448321 RepID=A0A317WLV5_9EURO|nr:uncharacterized protein BO70DRAFT_333069 [Aspergillus heteromorphus CBS 117.55]PWY86671.1 hypothetical protein BO70DRAFT_333069 [Aspergillus heteromorphus CBS 117.55]